VLALPEAKQAKELAARYHSCARPPLCRDDQSRCTAHRDLGYGQDCCQRRRGDIFVPVLSLVAVVVTAVVNCAPDEWLSAAMAISGVVLSGGASVEAILRGDWNSLMLDDLLSRISDLNRFVVKTSKSRDILYDKRDKGAPSSRAA
jgi:hypothetical protein